MAKVTPHPHIKWDCTWRQFCCFDKSLPFMYGYGPTMREAYKRWYILLAKNGMQLKVAK